MGICHCLQHLQVSPVAEVVLVAQFQAVLYQSRVLALGAQRPRIGHGLRLQVANAQRLGQVAHVHSHLRAVVGEGMELALYGGRLWSLFLGYRFGRRLLHGLGQSLSVRLCAVGRLALFGHTPFKLFTPSTHGLFSGSTLRGPLLRVILTHLHHRLGRTSTKEVAQSFHSPLKAHGVRSLRRHRLSSRHLVRILHFVQHILRQAVVDIRLRNGFLHAESFPALGKSLSITLVHCLPYTFIALQISLSYGVISTLLRMNGSNQGKGE